MVYLSTWGDYYIKVNRKNKAVLTALENSPYQPDKYNYIPIYDLLCGDSYDFILKDGAWYGSDDSHTHTATNLSYKVIIKMFKLGVLK